MNKKLFLLALLTSSAMMQGAAPKEEDPMVSCKFPGGGGGIYPLQENLEATKAHIAAMASLGDPSNVHLMFAARRITEETYPHLRKFASRETCIHVRVRNSK